MSWDIFVENIPEYIKSIEDLQKYEDFERKPIGKRSDIISKIKEVVPEADFSDPSWGQIVSQDCSIEVNIGEDEECYGFAFHVRGNEKAVYVVAKIIEHLGLRAFDPSADDGMFKIGPDLVKGFREWKRYRDYLMGRKDK